MPSRRWVIRLGALGGLVGVALVLVSLGLPFIVRYAYSSVVGTEITWDVMWQILPGLSDGIGWAILVSLLAALLMILGNSIAALVRTPGEKAASGARTAAVLGLVIYVICYMIVSTYTAPPVGPSDFYRTLGPASWLIVVGFLLSAVSMISIHRQITSLRRQPHHAYSRYTRGNESP